MAILSMDMFILLFKQKYVYNAQMYNNRTFSSTHLTYIIPMPFL